MSSSRERGRGDPKDDLQPLLEAVAGGIPIFGSVEDLQDRTKIEEAVKRALERVRPEIPRLWRMLPREFQSLIENLAHRENADLYDVTAEWLVQRMLFREIGDRFKLEAAYRFPANQPDCFMALTRSGSLLSGGKREPVSGHRPIEYVRIPSRMRSWREEGQPVTFYGRIGDIERGSSACILGELTTSPVQYILVIPSGMTGQFQIIRGATTRAVQSTVLPRDK